MVTSDKKTLIKDSITLPITNFPMKANLPTKEVIITDLWQNICVYEKLISRRKDKPQFLLHFGPPYANGNFHIGHAFNLSLKDITIRIRSMEGHYTPILPTWDCHGLPIEYKVEEQLRKDGKNKNEISTNEFRKLCHDFAQYWVNKQRKQALRLGFLGDWKNPYLTMDKNFELNILKEIYKFVNNGTLYRDLRPVMWSVVEETTLAEYETEYHDIVSDAIYVGFPIISASLPQLVGAKAIIWTTTSWTIPANRALAFGQDIDYVLIKVNKLNDDKPQKFVIAKDQLTEVMTNMNITSFEEIISFKGYEMMGSLAQHPLHACGYDFEVKCIIGHHVNTSSGTGIVHTAPSHGPDDFQLGKKYNLEVPDLVDGKGFYKEDVPIFAGQHIFKVDVINVLEENDNLFFHEKHTHSYPHSWRSKAPLIYRTTNQWFIEIDKSGIRDLAIKEVNKVKWWPKQGKNRLTTMLTNRPDWCLSRQRVWGVPIAIFVHKEDGSILRDIKVQKRIENAFLEQGSDIWFAENPMKFLGEDYNWEDYEAVFDIVDVWFESGTTHAAVLQNNKRYPNIDTQADLYLEGSDQHRGWFQSSLLESCGTTKQSPYRQVLTHGFVLDDKGYKMSKSAKNGLSPEEIIEGYGAEIIRIWTAHSDYYDDVRIGKENLKQCQDLYRKLRNTLRYLLGVLNKNDEDLELGDLSTYTILERWILASIYQVDEQVKTNFKNFEFKSAYTTIHSFCVNTLSAFYFDVRKDVLYCEPKNSPLRSQVTKVFNHIFHWLVRILAPLTPFTCEEAWLDYHNIDINKLDKIKIDDDTYQANLATMTNYSSIHYEEFSSIPKEWQNDDLLHKMQHFITFKNNIDFALEQARSKKIINSSSQAHVVCHKDWDLDFNKNDIITMLMVAELEIGTPDNCETSFKSEKFELTIGISKTTFNKCERCWHLMESVVQKQKASLCARCSTVLIL